MGSRLDDLYFGLGFMDRLSHIDTPVHRLDPRAKLLATAAFTLVVVSFPKYEVAGLLPFFLFPVLMLTIGDIPPGFIIKKVLIVSPFALFVGIFNPVFDRRLLLTVYGFEISAGWISFLSIMVKFALTISAALLLVATTSFPRVCGGMKRLGLPSGFVTQMLFLYRYIFVLAEEALRMLRARDMRTFGGGGTGLLVYARLMGTLFIRAVERAERIYSAMLSRGFKGEVALMEKSGFGLPEVAYLALVAVSLYVFRTWDVTALLGSMLGETGVK